MRLPNNINISIPNMESEFMLMGLDRAGVACSAGSACTSASLEPSHVLMAIGLSPDAANGSLRFSMGRQTTRDEVGSVLEALLHVVDKLSSM